MSCLSGLVFPSPPALARLLLGHTARRIIVGGFEMEERTVQSELSRRSYPSGEIVQMLQKQVLIVPELTVSSKDASDRAQLVRSDVADIKKILAKAGYQTEIILAKTLPRRTLVQKGGDIVLPLVLFSASIPLNVVTGYISTWLFTRFQGNQQVTIKYEHARFGPDGKIKDYVKLEGKPEEVAKILKSGKFELKNYDQGANSG